MKLVSQTPNLAFEFLLRTAEVEAPTSEPWDVNLVPRPFFV